MMNLLSKAVLLVVAVLMMPTATEALISPEPVSKLLSTYADNIASLKQACVEQVGADGITQQPYCNDVFYLRYALADEESAVDSLESNLKWRLGEGKALCDSASSALEQAMAGGGWDNDPVLKAAPHSATISKFLTPSNVITTTSSKNDLVYCIRAGSIDDVGLMEAVSVDEMAQFFLYAKEINAMVANERSVKVDQLLSVITANDLAGVKLIGGSSDFRNALSACSKQANGLYPALAGPALLLNLPKLLSALVKLFTPLFPPEVKSKIKFQQGLLKGVDDLQKVATSATGPERTTFLQQLDDTVYN